MSDATKSAEVLRVVLRVYGTVAGLAILAVFMPPGWMATVHQWVGLGRFPDGPIMEYLARSLSAFYAMHGALLWVLSRDVRRYAGVIVFIAIAGIIFGALILALDIRLRMPLVWILCEGPVVIVISSVILALWAKSRTA